MLRLARKLLMTPCQRLMWFTACLSIGFCLREASTEEPAVPVIVLGSGHGVSVQTGTKTYHGLLVRELLRQSLLLAAREELEIRVHDVTIGEATAAEANWELACSPGNPNLLELLR